MIWVDGQILPDDGLTINASDRTFEHGLGLFETFRSWSGRAPLLEAHKARMLRSAGALEIPLDPARLPDDRAVRSLLEAHGGTADRLLRITATGGCHPLGSVVWLRSSHPIGVEVHWPATLNVALDTWAIPHHDRLARHKSLNFWARRLGASTRPSACSARASIARGAGRTCSSSPTTGSSHPRSRPRSCRGS
jgi:branched-chain amino acid aminotransferase